MTLQGYATHFSKQYVTVAEIKTSTDKLNDKMEYRTMKSQDFDMCFDVIKSGLQETDFQSC